MEKRDALGVSSIKSEFARIASIKNHGELAVYFARASKYGLATPFFIGQYVDLKILKPIWYPLGMLI
jgi:predicted metalloendopeptidase